MKIGDIKLINGTKYLILSIITKNDVNYFMLNKLDKNEEPTERHEVFKEINGALLLETNKKILNELLPEFSREISDLITDLAGDIDE